MTMRIHYTISDAMSASDEIVDVSADTLQEVTQMVSDTIATRGLSIAKNGVWTEEIDE